jgi:hypothetical protein
MAIWLEQTPDAIEIGIGNAVTVRIVEELGAEAFVPVRLAADSSTGTNASTDIVARVESRSAPAHGEVVNLHVDEASVLFFDAVSGDRIVDRARA